MKQKWSMHQGCMLVPLPVKELVRELCVQALVMAHNAITQAPKTSDDGQNNKDKIDCFLPVQVDRSQQRTGKKILYWFLRC